MAFKVFGQGLGVYRVAAKELNLSYYIGETLFIYYMYQLWQFNLSSFPSIISTQDLSSSIVAPQVLGSGFGDSMDLELACCWQGMEEWISLATHL